MNVKARLRLLEKVIRGQEPFRVLFVANDADHEAEVAGYRKDSGYQGTVVVMDEADRAL